MKYYFRTLKKYAVFKGRASRKEYWLSVLFYSIFFILAIVLDNICGTTMKGIFLGWIYLTYVVLTFVPFLALGVRRIHDSGRIGWMCLTQFIPLIGLIWFLYLMLIKGEQVANEYGEVPS